MAEVGNVALPAKLLKMGIEVRYESPHLPLFHCLDWF